MAKDNISIASLFGISPEEYQYQRAQNDLDTITTAAPNNGVNQLLMLGGRQLGRGLGDLMGAQDPTLARLTKIQAVGKMVQDSGVDPSNPDEVYPAMIKGFQQAGLMQEAMMASQQFQGLQAQRQKATTDRLRVEADLTTAQATADKNRQEAIREAKLREELDKLPADATEDQILSVYKRFADASKGLTALTTSMDKKAQREMQIENKKLEVDGRIRQAEIAAEARIDAARIQGATQQQIAQMRIDAANQLEAIRQQGRKELEAIKAELFKDKKQFEYDNKPMDDKAASRIADSSVFKTTADKADALLKTIDENKDAFSLKGRGLAFIESFKNDGTPRVKALSDVQAYLKEARNAYLLASKGVQTEGDAQRAWDQFVGKLDFSTAAGAKRAVQRVQEELKSKAAANEEYLKARKLKRPEDKAKAAPKAEVEVKVFGGAGTSDDPIFIE